MPGRDGAGPPLSTVKRTGRRSSARPVAGPGGDCVCPRCGARITHERGAPCYNLECPECGTKMVRG